MTLVKYKYNDTSKLSEHFKVNEFKCKCGKDHDIIIDNELVPLLEKVRSKLNSKACNIYSGYRCPSHNKKVSKNNATNGYSHSGYAVDCYFLDQNRKRIPSRNVCLALEDLGHKCGIGYRCGGSANSTGNTHIDVKSRKWYGDESISMNESCCISFYDYFGIEKIITGIIAEWQTAMNNSYNCKLVVDNSFGPDSQNQATKYQLYLKNPQFHNDYVLFIQKQLNKLGYTLKEDGYFGSNTSNAVKTYQKSKNLKVDGYVGLNTITAILKEVVEN